MFGSGFGQRPASTGGNMFGGASNTASTPFGATTNNNPSPFGATNNNQAPSGGLFGSQQPAQQASGLFGSNNNNSAGANQPSTGFGFGANNNNTSTGTTGGLFGNNQAAINTGFGATNTASTGGLFGANNNTNTAPASGGLFGNNNASTQSSGGLFGANNNTVAPTTSGIFGSNNNAASTTTTGGLFGAKPAAPASGGLFGNTGATNTASTGGLFGAKPAVPTTGSLFGSTAQSTTGGGLIGNNAASTATTSGGLFGAKPAPTGGLFGSSYSAAPPASGSIFGNTATATAPATGGLFGNTTVQQSQTQQPQLLITPLTTIAEFPEQYRREIEQLDTYIQSQVQICEQLKTDQEEHKDIIESIPRDIEYLTNKYSHTNHALSNDISALQEIRQITDEALRDSENFFVLLQRLLTSGSKISSVEIDTYFTRKVEFYKVKIQEYTGILAEIDNAVEGIERDSISDVNGISLVASTLKEEFKLFMELANTVADIHQKVKLLQESHK